METMETLTHQPLHPDMVRDQVTETTHGAVIVFEGVVRDNFNDKTVIGLEYEAYPEMVDSFVAALKEEIEGLWPEVRVAVLHRLGHLEVGDTSLLVAIAAPHRPEAYEASRHSIEAIKAGLPVWKKEIFADGSHWKPNEP